MGRCVRFRKLVGEHGPKVILYANANAGRRSSPQAIREGVVAGVFDYTAVWPRGVAWLELKSFDKRGRACTLSLAQVEFGNRLVSAGHRAAAFFDPRVAVEWLGSCGAPIGEVPA